MCLAGDLVVDVRNRELDILMELLSRLRILEPRLRTAAQRLAELDVLLAFTAAALKYQWVTGQRENIGLVMVGGFVLFFFWEILDMVFSWFVSMHFGILLLEYSHS